MRLPYKTGQVRITSPYGNRTLNGAADWHNGIDFVSDGDKQIVAVCGGVVLQSRMVTDKSNLTWEWGNYVSVQGDDGKTIYYCHMAQRKVVQGQRVEAGHVLGIEGNTGYSFGTHCHFEVRNSPTSAAIDPAAYLGIRNAVQTFSDAAREWMPYYKEQVQKKCGLEAQTMAYLEQYKYAPDLMRKLAEAMA